MNFTNPRALMSDIDSMFWDRWSPRSFLDETLTESEFTSLFEAARWSPSCSNEQPWMFVFAREKKDRDKVLDILVPKNRLWAKNAPLLVMVISKNVFMRNGKPNRHASFDTGAAWMALTLQARKRGLYAHAMAGFDLEKAYHLLGLTQETHTVLAVVAIGKRGSVEQLPVEFHALEIPNSRKPLSEFVFDLGSLNRDIG